MGSIGKALFIAVGLTLAAPSIARAEPEGEITHAQPEGQINRAEESIASKMPKESNIDFVGTLGASVDKAAIAASIGARLRFSEDWHVGLHAEYNPYGSVTRLKLRSGSANFFGSLDYRWVKTGRISLTTIGYLGASWLLFDLVGVPKNAVGPYIALTPLCAEVRLSPRTSLLIESMRVAIPIPQISGVPFAYRQYRVSVGIAIALD
jgi:hypothetical protein